MAEAVVAEGWMVDVVVGRHRFEAVVAVVVD
jgi:hypothetical protein